MRTADVMTKSVVFAFEDDSLEHVARLMLEHKIGGVPVVNRDLEVVGIVTETDFSLREKGVPFSALRLPSLFGQWCAASNVEQIYQAARARAVREVMSRPVVAVDEDLPVGKVAELMLRKDLKRIPVVRAEKLVGIVTRHDLLRCITAPAAPESAAS